MRSFFRIGITIAALTIFGYTLTAEGSHIAPPILGWLWGGSTDDSLGGGVPSIDSATGIGWVSVTSDNQPCNIASNPNCYGLAFPLNGADGPVTDYAWSSSVGWINFQPGGTAPDGSNLAGVQRVGNNLAGWARIVSIQQAVAVGNSGGWQGWIKMSGTAQNGSPYGVTVELGAGTATYDSHLEGYAWSDELGWIYFGPPNPPFPEIQFGVPPGLPTVTVDTPDQIASENGPNPGQFSISLSCTGPFSGSLQVDYAIAGNATNGNDYQSIVSPDSYIFTACPNTFLIDVKTIDDAVKNEDFESVILNVASDPTAYSLTVNQNIVTIEDNDGNPRLSVSCSGQPGSNYKITWTSTPVGGTLPYAFSWSFPGGVPVASASQSQLVDYTLSGKGIKTATINITDKNGTPASNTCTANAVQFYRKEIPPFFF